MSEDKYLDKLSKLLRLAETTTNANEAEAYMAKAQSLATAMSLSLETARQNQANKEKRQTPIQKRISLGESGKKGLKHYVNLFRAVAHNNDLKLNIYHDSSGVIVFGFPSDIEVSELLYASLVSQMIESSDRYLRSGAYKNELSGDYYYNKEGMFVRRHIDGRVARANFQEAFINTISSRLAFARLEAVEEARDAERETKRADTDEEPTSSGTDLVIRNKEIELTDFYKSESKARGSWKGDRSSSGYSSASRAAGRTAGQSARLGAQRSIGTGPKGITR